MNLILSPHMDDEVLGCASFLDGDTTVLYFTQGHPSFPGWRREMEKVANEAGFQVVAFDYPIHHIEGQAKIITDIERTIAGLRPDTVLIPFKSYNQDHRAIHLAAITAMRPNDKQHFVKRILVYEEPDVFGSEDTFKPNYFRLIDIEWKLNLYEIYQSQMRRHRNILRGMAEIRGMQAGLPFAEAFEVLRWVDA